MNAEKLDLLSHEVVSHIAPIRYALLITCAALVKASLMLCPYVVCSSSFCRALAISKLCFQMVVNPVYCYDHIRKDDITDTASMAPRTGVEK